MFRVYLKFALKLSCTCMVCSEVVLGTSHSLTLFWNIFSMYNSITTQEPFNPWNTLLTISIVMFGNYIIMNLFISILLQGFGDEDEEELKGHEDSVEGLENGAADGGVQQAAGGMLLRRQRSQLARPPGMMAKFRALMWKKKSAHVSGSPAQLAQRLGATALNWPSQSGLPGEAGEQESQAKAPVEHLVKIKYLKKSLHIPSHASFGFLSKANPVRIVCAAIAQHPIFENLIILCIFITTIMLLLERPDDGTVAAACPQAPDFLDCSGLPPGQVVEINCARNEKDEQFGWVWDRCDARDSGRIPACCSVASRVKVFTYMDTAFTIIFLVEMVSVFILLTVHFRPLTLRLQILKMVSDGFIFHELAYFRSAWNLLDFFIVIVSMISAFGDTSSLKSLKALRAVRALRPLRVIKRNPGLKIAVVCLLSSIPALMNVMVVVLLWFSMYAMLGVQIFKGGLYRSVFDFWLHAFHLDREN